MVEEMLNEEKNLTPWELMELGLIKVESEGNHMAVSSVGARGLFQIMPIFVKEVNRLCKIHGIDKHYTFDDAFDITKSFEMFNIMNTYHNQRENEYERIALVIKKHNPNAGDWYSKRVYSAMFEIITNENERNKYLPLLYKKV
jgi:Transglycosylase SLT domain.